MARTRKSSGEKILALLRRGPQRGLTAADISSRAELNINTTRTVLWALQQAGDISVVSTTESTGGRPANRYTLALAA